MKHLQGSPAHWDDATETWPGITCYVCGILPYAVYWNCEFLLHTAHYLFLKDLMRSCAIGCVSFSCCQWYHASLHPWIICCESENSLSQWYGQWLSKGSGWVPTTMWGGEGRDDGAFKQHFRLTRTLHRGRPGAVQCSVIKSLKLGEANVELQQTLKMQQRQEHQKELWTTWLSCKQKERGQRTGSELKHCLHILKASDECRAPWLGCYWLNSDRHCWTLSQRVWK